MSIILKKINKIENDYISSIRKSTSFLVDIIITFTLRYALYIICFYVWFGNSLNRFFNAVYEKYYENGFFKEGSGLEVFYFFLNHNFFVDVIFILILMQIVGFVYYTILLHSDKRSTYGMRFMRIHLKSKGSLSLTRIICRYIVGLLPWGLFCVAVLYLSFGDYKSAFLFMVAIFVWQNPNIIGNKNRSAHDYFCATRLSQNENEK